MEKDSGVELTGRERQLSALKEHGKDTQFGGERGNPQAQDAGGAKPWSYRNSLRNLSHRKLGDDDDIDKMSEGEIIKRILPTKTPTLVQIGAARELARLAKGNGNPQFVTDQLDGKLAQTNINADFATILGMTDDELDTIIAGADSKTAARAGGDGEEAPGRSEGSDPGEA